MIMKKILIIDDDADLTFTIEAILKYAGFEAIIANDGQTGINQSRTHQPDLILLDIMMPGMNGADFIKKLKADNSLKNIPVLFLTGLVDFESESEQITVGDQTYDSIPKPFENEKLIEKVKIALKE